MSTIFDAYEQAQTQAVAPELSALGRAALDYAARGWRVFPCHPGQKEPMPVIGQNASTTDADKIARWWTATPDANIGLHLAPSGLLAVDMDTYKGEVTAAGELPPTLMQTSARGGVHAIYAADPQERYGRNGSTNLDVKHRGYVLVEPSRFEGGQYSWQQPIDTAKPGPAPQWLKRPKIDRTKQAMDSSGRTLAEVEEALRHVDPDMPYDDWLKVLMALHQGFGNEALTIAEEWSDRSANPSHVQGPDIIEEKFSSFTDSVPNGVTIAHVFHLARESGADLAQLAERHRVDNLLQQFQPADPESFPKSIFEVVAEQEREHEQADIYPLLRPSDLAKRPPPVFLIGRHIPQNGLGFLVSHPGVGKSFLALDMGLTIAAGKTEWQGEVIQATGDSSVIYIASEGSFDLPLRIAAWKEANGFTGDLDRFLILEASVNFMDKASVAKLIRSVTAINTQPALVVVDTVSRALPGADENLQKDMTLFVEACDAIRTAFQCSVMGLHHSAKSGGIRGSSVLEGAGDFIMLMDRDKGEETGTLTMHKQKAAEDGWSYPFDLKKVTTPSGKQSLAFSKTKLTFPEDTATAADKAASKVQNTPPSTAYPFAQVLEDMRFAWLDSKPWSKEPRAKGRYAVHIMSEKFGIPRAIAKAALDQWLSEGTVESRVQNSKEKRPGLYVVTKYEECDVFG